MAAKGGQAAFAAPAPGLRYEPEGAGVGPHHGDSYASSASGSDDDQSTATSGEAAAGALSLQLLLAGAQCLEDEAGAGRAAKKPPRKSAAARAAARAPAAATTADTARRPDQQNQMDHSHMTAAKLVHQAETSRLDSWEDIEFLLRDDTHTYGNRPALCARNWGVYRESPKVPRRGKGGQRDLWTNSGGLRGATVWPAVESGQQPRVRRQYGKIKRVGQTNGQSELKFLEYSLVDDPAVPLQASLLQRRLFQTLPIDSMGVKAIKPMRATIEVPAQHRTIGRNVPVPSRSASRPPLPPSSSKSMWSISSSRSSPYLTSSRVTQDSQQQRTRRISLPVSAALPRQRHP